MRVSRLPEEEGFADFFQCIGCDALSVFDVPPPRNDLSQQLSINFDGGNARK
jgi:hypothetical protein